MEQSILRSTKKILGVSPDDTTFDDDILTHINSEFSILTDLGIGPAGGFVVEDADPEWAAYTSGFPDDPDDPDHTVKLSKVKTAVHLRARLLFDPPVSQPHLTSMQEQLKEHEWRLNVNREAYAWVDPTLNPEDGFGEDGFGL